MTFLTTLVYFILAILIIGIIFMGIQEYKNKKNKDPLTTNVTYPPSDYMLSQGLLCPDWWDPTDIDTTKGVVTCSNPFGVKIQPNAPAICSNPSSFSYVPSWPPATETELKTLLKDRCTWVAQCGPTQNTPAAWTAINSICPSVSL
jgi:hypothetical protein